MTWTRRHMLQLGGAAIAATALPLSAETKAAGPPVIRPKRLKQGDLVGFINPAGASFDRDGAAIAREAMAALGLRTVFGDHLFDRYGYLAGRDED
jgi:muramoyltetrapeptide carboxypeptidase